MLNGYGKNVYEECRFVLSVAVCFLTTLVWSRRVVRRSRPVLYLVDSSLIICAFTLVIRILSAAGFAG